MLNVTRPYKIGDWIVIDSSLEGRVMETNWRATHLFTADHDIAVVPNSTLGKTRFTNTTLSLPFRGITVRLQLPPNVRPSVATTALAFAAYGYEEVLRDPPPQITVRSSTVEAVEYEIRFFVARELSGSLAIARFFDLAFQHLDSMNVDRHPPLANAKPALASYEDRLIEGAQQSIEPRTQLHVETRTFAAGETFEPGLHTPHGRICVSTGVLSIRQRTGSEEHEVARLNPGDSRSAPFTSDEKDAVLLLYALTDARVLLMTDQPSVRDPRPGSAAGHEPGSPDSDALAKCQQPLKPVSIDRR
jgi:hypothetical protein